jgi:hypothetical protein
VIRERFKIQRQVRVHTAQGRLTMALLLAMPPTVLAILLIFSPDFVKRLFFETSVLAMIGPNYAEALETVPESLRHRQLCCIRLEKSSPRQATSNAISEKRIDDLEISEALTMLKIFRIKQIAVCLGRRRHNQ